MLAMNFKPKKHCIGVFVICTIAILTFHSGVCESAGYSAKPPENGMQSAEMFREKRQSLGSRQRLGRSNIDHRFMKSRDASGMYQNDPFNNFNTNCNKGEVKYIVEGRADFDGAGQASVTHFPSGPVHPDTQTEVRGGLQPVVKCTQDSMILTVPRRWAAQLRDVRGKDLIPLSTEHLQCGYSIYKNGRDISIGVQFSGCHVTQEGDRYVLPLLWRTARFKISCPSSPAKSQALEWLSLCCYPSRIEIGIKGPPAAKELNVNVRGEWTSLFELVQHCDYSMDWSSTEIVISAQFPSCGITSRDGKHALSLQISKEVFVLTCSMFPSEVPQLPSPPPTTSTTRSVPFQRTPPFYLAPPHYPHPIHHHKTRLNSVAPLTSTTAPFVTRQLETPQQDQQPKVHVYPADERYRKPPSSRNSGEVLPHLKQTSSRTHSPVSASGYGLNMLPHNYAFNPFYRFYHHPKIPQTNRSPDLSNEEKPKQTETTTPIHPSLPTNSPQPNPQMPHNSGYLHDLTRTNFADFWTHMRSVYPSPLPTFVSQTFAPVTPSVKPTHSPTNQHSLYHLSTTPNSPMYHHLPYDFHALYEWYRRFQGANWPTPASFPLPQQTTKSIPPSVDPNIGFGSYFQPELPLQFKLGNDPARGLNNEGKSAAHSDASFDGSSWEKWFNMAAKVNNVPDPLHFFSAQFPMPEQHTVDGNVQAGSGNIISLFHTAQSSASGAALPSASASPCCSGTGSHFQRTPSPSCISFPVKDCTAGEYFVFSLPEFVVEPKVVGHGRSDGACALKRLPSSPHEYFVPLHGCGVTKQVINSLMVYQLELETCDSLMRVFVECRSFPGFPIAVSRVIMDPLSVQSPLPLQMRIATNESSGFRPEAHAPLSSLRGRLLLMELRLLQSPDPGVRLQVHYCLAYTLAPYASAMLVYDRCLSGSESQLLPSFSSDTQYIVVNNFLSPTSPSPSTVVDSEVYFFCLGEVCSASDTVCSAGLTPEWK